MHPKKTKTTHKLLAGLLTLLYSATFITQVGAHSSVANQNKLLPVVVTKNNPLLTTAVGKALLTAACGIGLALFSKFDTTIGMISLAAPIRPNENYVDKLHDEISKLKQIWNSTCDFCDKKDSAIKAIVAAGSDVLKDDSEQLFFEKSFFRAHFMTLLYQSYDRMLARGKGNPHYLPHLCNVISKQAAILKAAIAITNSQPPAIMEHGNTPLYEEDESGQTVEIDREVSNEISEGGVGKSEQPNTVSTESSEKTDETEKTSIHPFNNEPLVSAELGFPILISTELTQADTPAVSSTSHEDEFISIEGVSQTPVAYSPKTGPISEAKPSPHSVASPKGKRSVTRPPSKQGGKKQGGKKQGGKKQGGKKQGGKKQGGKKQGGKKQGGKRRRGN